MNVMLCVSYSSIKKEHYHYNLILWVWLFVREAEREGIPVARAFKEAGKLKGLETPSHQALPPPGRAFFPTIFSNASQHSVCRLWNNTQTQLKMTSDLAQVELGTPELGAALPKWTEPVWKKHTAQSLRETSSQVPSAGKDPDLGHGQERVTEVTGKLHLETDREGQG